MNLLDDALYPTAVFFPLIDRSFAMRLGRQTHTWTPEGNVVDDSHHYLDDVTMAASR